MKTNIVSITGCILLIGLISSCATTSSTVSSSSFTNKQEASKDIEQDIEQNGVIYNENSEKRMNAISEERKLINQ